MSINSTFSHRGQEPEKKVLYIVGTPIGNLEDISFRALKILRNVSLIACEDTRQTKKIMSRFKISNNLISFNKINSFKRIPQIINDLQLGKSVALVSDAGMPSICDPGEDLVKIAKLNGIDIICIPGPCAALTALVTSGMKASNFIFEGFLPKKKKDREKILFEISKTEKTTILYESPHRIKKLLEELKVHCGGDREIQVSRELTKKHEEHIGMDINSVMDFLRDKEMLGEITLIINGTNKEENSDIDISIIKKELNDLIYSGISLSSASKYLAKKFSLNKNLIYNLK